MNDDVIYLIRQEATGETNDINDAIYTDTERQVFCEKKSVRQSEFYQAKAQGVKPELMFKMRIIDYEDEERLRYVNEKNVSKKYDIIRTYAPDNDWIELICAGVVNKTQW